MVCGQYPSYISRLLNPTQHENWSFGTDKDILILESRIVMQKQDAET
jgi:hypothetical protein